jgi:hypothetical protein
MRYSPNAEPDASEWLASDEDARIRATEVFRRLARIRLPKARVHAAIHAAIENQIALGHGPTVRAMARLSAKGLSRHDCLHATGWVLAMHVYAAPPRRAPMSAAESQERFDLEMDRLTAQAWRASGSMQAAGVTLASFLSAAGPRGAAGSGSGHVPLRAGVGGKARRAGR